MIIEKKFLNKIKDFGLNSYEAKIWTALLSRGVSTAGELAEISNVPRSRSYDVLESLEKKGFVIMKIDKPIKYMAVPPSEVLERVKKRTLENAEKQVELIDSLKESELLEELKRIHSQGIDFVEPQELSAYLRSRSHQYTQLDTMLRNAAESVFLITTSSGLISLADTLKRSLAKAAKRGVKIKILAPLHDVPTPILDSLKEVAVLKHTASIKSKCCIIDNKEVLFALLDDGANEAYDGAIWVKSPFFAGSLIALFHTIWKDAKELKDIKVVQ
ncbi:MAG: helix-turn-helix domain-containing protein [Candidatus Woesearchaeota archaeon]